MSVSTTGTERRVFYVLEWQHSEGGWFTISGHAERSRAWTQMRQERIAAPTEKFRVTKYVPEAAKS